MRSSRVMTSAVATAAAALVLAACGSSSDDSALDDAAGSGEFPVTVEHAFGETTIESEPERVAAVGWSNDEVALALGIVPVGMTKANYGDDDGDGILPWTEERLEELDAEAPVLFDDTEGVDFEAVADTQPDVILAAYSGLSQEEYDTLSKIAPVVAYPDTPWGTEWRETIEMNSRALGLEQEGQDLIADLEQQIADGIAERPELEGKTGAFVYLDPSDLSKVSYYTTHDPRAAFLVDLGLRTPALVEKSSTSTDQFFLDQSAEEADAFDDTDILISYGSEQLLPTLQADPLLSQIPAVADGAVVILEDNTPLAAAGNPSPLSLPWALSDYLDLLADAASKVQ
ncbi:iron-siderophore ABC transporter substrate-binding protein [Aeromicrobium phragmitis]|uniref:Iron-siderophore ABC transporter substrate-binding protein n=1 Tax=Aeromicrobium phragmitis TaxID=2478914 RepID=A0A3L8PMZ1_9ACTN|nr:iron-siderophore ABC transporter substrate-binding protein [Aeromicrobium phragmitis]RLV55858.1 iron-siderophore ABC transporter substrate-binding protein [Aeromicrobium phragmitis]